MTKPLVLDSGPLGRIAHPKPSRAFVEWIDQQLAEEVRIVLPEIADFEVRRSLLLTGLTRSLERLDVLKSTLEYLPLSTETMLLAADFWAASRRRGQTTADPKELNGDVILAAQTSLIDGMILTDNVGHLRQFCQAQTWEELR